MPKNRGTVEVFNSLIRLGRFVYIVFLLCLCITKTGEICVKI